MHRRDIGQAVQDVLSGVGHAQSGLGKVVGQDVFEVFFRLVVDG